MKHKLCKFCAQPVKPKGLKKKPDEFDHAQGCPKGRMTTNYQTGAFSLPDFLATAPHPSGKCQSCRRKTQHFYHYADAHTKLCIRCIEAGLTVMREQQQRLNERA